MAVLWKVLARRNKDYLVLKKENSLRGVQRKSTHESTLKSSIYNGKKNNLLAKRLICVACNGNNFQDLWSGRLEMNIFAFTSVCRTGQTCIHSIFPPSEPIHLICLARKIGSLFFFLFKVLWEHWARCGIFAISFFFKADIVLRRRRQRFPLLYSWHHLLAPEAKSEWAGF